MKNHSRVLSWQSLENIYLLKLASEASQENFEKIVFLTTKYEQIVKLEHLLCPKVGGGGGGSNPLAPPPAPLLLRPCIVTSLLRQCFEHIYTQFCEKNGKRHDKTLDEPAIIGV